MKLVLRSLVSFVVFFPVIANAGIIDNESELAGSFKDSSTGLVWMDFGITVNQSFDSVVLELLPGGIYQEWRLPTRTEVFTMWSNVAGIGVASPDIENLGAFGPGTFNNSDRNPSIWEPTWAAIGFNREFEQSGFTRRNSSAVFEGSNGLGVVSYRNWVDSTAFDGIFIRDDFNQSGDADIERSTLLVLSNNSVNDGSTPMPVPATLALLALGMFGMTLRRTALQCA